MPTNIDSLSIELSANAGRASSAIDELASRLGRLSSAASGAGSGTRTAADRISELGQAARNSDVEQVTSNLQDCSDAAMRAAHATETLKKVWGTLTAPVKAAISGVKGFVAQLARVAKYRFLRYVIKEIAAGFKEGVTNLYHWSEAVNNRFAKSMDMIATSTNYLKNSLGAFLAPLINALAPVIDSLVEKFVTLLNAANMFFAAVTGAETYTVAKKIADTWDDASNNVKNNAEKTEKAIKRTILGFDEINKLTKPTNTSSSSSSLNNNNKTDYSIMFEEKPLEGWLKNLSDLSNKVQDVTEGWPDWLKWLLGIGGAALAVIGIKKLLEWVGSLWDKLKGIALLNLPNWLKWLFGGGGGGGSDDGNHGINIPDHIDIPDADIDVNLQKGDWSVLDGLKDETALVKVGLQHWGWDNIQDWIGNVATVAVGLKHWGWTTIEEWIGPAVTVAVGLKHWGWTTIEDWIGRAVTVAVGLSHWGWNNIDDWIGNAVTVHVGLRKWGWTELKYWIGTETTVAVALAHDGWSTIEAWIGTSVTIKVKLDKDGWDTVHEWLGDNYKRDGKYGGGHTRGGGAGGTWEAGVDVALNIDKTSSREWLNEYEEESNTISDSIRKIWNSIVSWTTSSWDSVKETVGNRWDSVKTSVSRGTESIGTWISTKWNDITTWTTSTWNSVEETVSTKWDDIKTTVNRATESVGNWVSTKWNDITTWTTSTWNSVEETVSTKWDDLKTTVNRGTEKVGTWVKDTWNDLKSDTKDKWDNIKLNAVNTWITLKTNAQTTFGTIKRNVSDAWGQNGGAKGVLSSFIGWVNSVFSVDWEGAWTSIVEAFGTIFDDLKEKAKAPINAVIRMINNMIDAVERSINAIVNGINNRLKFNFEWSVPDWVPSWAGGGKTFKYSFDPGLHTVKFARVEELAEGGILNAATMLSPNVMAGEAGAEAVLPLDRNTEWMDKLADRILYRAANGNGSGSSAKEDGTMTQLMRQMLAEMRKLNEKEFTAEVSTSAINRAQTRANLRAGTTVSPVGV